MLRGSVRKDKTKYVETLTHDIGEAYEHRFEDKLFKAINALRPRPHRPIPFADFPEFWFNHNVSKRGGDVVAGRDMVERARELHSQEQWADISRDGHMAPTPTEIKQIMQHDLPRKA